MPTDNPNPTRREFIPRAKGTSPEQQAEWHTRHTLPVSVEKDRPHLPKGPSGFGVRLLLEWLEGYAPRTEA